MITSTMYDVIRKPVITEKSSAMAELGKYVFIISEDAHKDTLKQVVEFLFTVKVKKINIINVLGKVKYFKGRQGRRSDYKKAIVTLDKGYSIDFTRGVK